MPARSIAHGLHAGACRGGRTCMASSSRSCLDIVRCKLGSCPLSINKRLHPCSQPKQAEWMTQAQNTSLSSQIVHLCRPAKAANMAAYLGKVLQQLHSLAAWWWGRAPPFARTPLSQTSVLSAGQLGLASHTVAQLNIFDPLCKFRVTLASRAKGLAPYHCHAP